MKKTTLLFMLTITVATTVIISCQKQVDCPAFEDAHFDAWFPYTKNQQLVFRSTLNNNDTMVLAETIRTQGGTSSTLATCPVTATFGTYNSSDHMKITYEKFSNSTFSELRVGNFALMAGSIVENGITLTPVSTGFTSLNHESYSINGTTFTGVQEITRDTINNRAAGIYKVWIAKANGIAGYESFPSRERWVKQ